MADTMRYDNYGQDDVPHSVRRQYTKRSRLNRELNRTSYREIEELEEDDTLSPSARRALSMLDFGLD